MPFDPQPVVLHLADTEKVVRYIELLDGPPPWTINSASIIRPMPPGSVPPEKITMLNAARWRFTNVNPDLNTVVGTLVYDPKGGADAALDAIRNIIPAKIPSIDVTLNVICNGLSRTLVVNICP